MTPQMIREALGLSIEQMASRIRVDPKTLAEIENGVRSMPPEAISVFLNRLVTRGLGVAVNSAEPAA
jgi:transcriptional regulator with XRE-family HTH domain